MLVIDSRKALDAGIGTYIQELVPRVCHELQDIPCQLLVSAAAFSWAEQLKKEIKSNLSITLFEAAPFSVAEQILFRRILNKSMVFWATSMSHPLFYDGRYIATVHDVAQLALPSNMAGGLITKLASRVFLKSILDYSSSIIFVSEFTRTEFTRYVGNPKQSASVIHLGVSREWFDIDAGPRKNNLAPYFISVSSIRPHKNFAFLLKAFLSISSSIPHNLVIVGDKRGLNKIEPKLMNEVLHLGDRIKFLGHISDEDLKNWVANADAMIFPSLYEGFGLPPVEAMAAGCPVITSTSAAMKEVCGNAVIYFNPHELESLISSILSFALKDRTSLEELKKTGKEKASEYDWSIAAEATVKVIRQSLVEVY